MTTEASASVGLLPELYERLGERLDCEFVYLPYSSQTTQAQQAENRQADIISAFPDGAVSESSLQGRVLISVQEVGGETRHIYVGSPTCLSPSRVKALEQALEEIARFDICRRHGIIVAESAADKVLPPLSAPYAVHREYRYGKIKLTVYHRNED